MKKFQIPSLNLPALLKKTSLYPKFYFKCKDTGEERVALGAVKTRASIPLETETYYGTIPFEEDSPSFFFLPEVEIKQDEKATWVVLRKESFSFTEEPLSPPKLLEIPGEKLPWKEKVEQALHKIQKGHLEKVVLSNRFTWNLASSPYDILGALLKACPKTSTFAFAKEEGSCFLGSTPEKLFKREERSIFSEAIAGTRKRGSSQEEDKALLKELKDSIKDQQEVLIVEKFLKENLEPLCVSNSLHSSPSYIQTDTVQHLQFIFEGNLLPAVSDEMLINALHPTPAVCGSPAKKAKETIQEIEKTNRNLYAGLVGWTDQKSSAFHVAIRSALADRGKLHLFAGAGIVKGSDPEKEWEEINHKTAHWRNLCL